MGGVQKGLKKIYTPIRKIVDPLNIMDPFSILPGSTLEGKKPFTFDKTYGGALNKLFKGGGGGSYTPQQSSNSQFYNYLQQLQQQQGLASQQQQSATQLAQQNAFNAQQAAAASQAEQIGAGVPEQLAQIAASQPTQTYTPSDSVTAAYTPQLSQSQLAAMPTTMQGMQVTPNANVFTTPNVSDLKFGGA